MTRSFTPIGVQKRRAFSNLHSSAAFHALVSANDGEMTKRSVSAHHRRCDLVALLALTMSGAGACDKVLSMLVEAIKLERD